MQREESVYPHEESRYISDSVREKNIIKGLTKRELFACHIMSAFVVNATNNDPNLMAEFATIYADSLIEALKK